MGFLSEGPSVCEEYHDKTKTADAINWRSFYPPGWKAWGEANAILSVACRPHIILANGNCRVSHYAIPGKEV